MLFESAEQLLLSVPPARPAVLQFFTHVIQEYFRLCAANSSFEMIRKQESVLMRVLDILTKLLATGEGVPYRKFCAMVCQWCLNNLGELSRKFTTVIIGNITPGSGPSLQDVGRKWRCNPIVDRLVQVTEKSFPIISSDPQEDDQAIRILLQASSRFSPQFDWMIAHLGGQYPQVIIRRILLSSLSDFAAGGSDEGALKFQSAINILQHFQAANGPHLKQVLASLVQESISSVVPRSGADSHRTLVPFLLLLASSGGVGLRVLIAGLVADSLEDLDQRSLVSFFNRYAENEKKSFRQMAIHVLMLDDQVRDFHVD